MNRDRRSLKEICENISDSERSWCSKLHLQGLELLYEEATYRLFVEFRGHYEMPWEVSGRWENKWPTDLLLRDEFLAELEGGKSATWRGEPNAT